VPISPQAPACRFTARGFGCDGVYSDEGLPSIHRNGARITAVVTFTRSK
jgi:hypothetical protein